MKLNELFEQNGYFVIYNTSNKKLFKNKRWATNKGAKAALSKLDNPNEWNVASELFYIDKIKGQ